MANSCDPCQWTEIQMRKQDKKDFSRKIEMKKVFTFRKFKF